MKSIWSIFIISAVIYVQGNCQEASVLWSVGSDATFSFEKIKPYNEGYLLGGHFSDSISIGDTTFFSAGDDDLFFAVLNQDYEIIDFRAFGGISVENIVDYRWQDNHLFLLYTFQDSTRFDDLMLCSQRRSRNYAVLKLDSSFDIVDYWQLSSNLSMLVSNLSPLGTQLNLTVSSQDSMFVNNRPLPTGAGLTFLNLYEPELAVRAAEYSGIVENLILLQTDSLSFIVGLFEGRVSLNDSVQIMTSTRFRDGFVLDMSSTDDNQLLRLKSNPDIRLLQASIIDNQLQLIVDYVSTLEVPGQVDLFGPPMINTSAVLNYSNGLFSPSESRNLGFQNQVLRQVTLSEELFCGRNFQTNEGFLVLAQDTVQFVGSAFAECHQAIPDEAGSILALVEVDSEFLSPISQTSAHRGNAYLLRLKLPLSTSLGETEVNPHFVFYPNPTSSNFNIWGPNWSHGQLYNMQMQLIQTFTPGHIIHVSNLTAGSYVVVLYDGHKKLLSKLIVKQ